MKTRCFSRLFPVTAPLGRVVPRGNAFAVLAAVLMVASAAVSAATAEGPVASSVAPPVVVRTIPVAGTENVDPALAEISVTFSRTMLPGSWSWATWREENSPAAAGTPRYLEDGRTCVLPVKLEPGRFYAIWLNSQKFTNFKDADRIPALPYLLTFRTAATSRTPSAPPPDRTAEQGPGTHALALLNADQRAVLEWTDRQFRGFFDARRFDGWAAEERRTLEQRLLDALKGPVNREYYQAINTLAALRSTNALPDLRRIGLERRDKDNRDRWMSIRALGLLGDQASIPELIHLVYHGNVNTRWWAQITLVRLTGVNHGSDWQAWGRWWNERRGQPPFQPEIVRWWAGQAESDQLAASLAESDKKFLEGLRR